MANKRMQAAKARAQAAREAAPAAGLDAAVPARGLAGEDLYREAFRSRDVEGMSAGELVSNERVRRTLLAKAGFDFLDVRDLTPNARNSYAVEQGSIEALADLIFESKNTTPLVVREVPIDGAHPKGYEIVDGERRYRAHLLLGERYGEHWYMVPARTFHVGELSDEDALFMLHAENVGQRAMTPSERARGVAAVTDRIMARRKADPSYEQGRKTQDIIAEQFGITGRSAVIEANIGRGLGSAGMEAYDEGVITKRGADALSHLPEGEQDELVARVRTGALDKYELEGAGKARSAARGKPAGDGSAEAAAAKRALAKAVAKGARLDRVLVAELRGLVDELDRMASRA